MTIRFKCSDPSCRKPMRAPDGTAGKKARCPLCSTVQVIPELSLEEGLIELASPATDPCRGDGGQTISCGDCGRAFPASAALCPACGWVNGSTMGPPSLHPTAPEAPGTGLGKFGNDCIKAIVYGTTNYRSVFKLVIYSVALSIGLSILYNLLNFLMFVKGGQIVLSILNVAALLVMGGFFLRFYLDCIISSLEGVDQAPDVPDFNIKAHFLTGLRGLGIVVVYVLPVVTLPLLPLGLLALGYSNDTRAYNVFWAARAAAKRPMHLLISWVMLLVWVALSYLAGWLVIMLYGGMAAAAAAGGGIDGFVLALLIGACGVANAVAVITMFVCVIFRCIGMMGRHCPDLTDMLAEQANPTAALGFIGGGTAVSVLVLMLIGRGLDGGSALMGPDADWQQAGESGGDREFIPPQLGPAGYLETVLSARDKANLRKTQSNLKQLAVAMFIYAQIHDGKFPPTIAAVRLPPDLTTSPGDSSSQYVYIAPGGPESPQADILAYDPVPYGGRIAIVCTDGHVEELASQEELEKRLAAQGVGDKHYD